MHQFVYTTNKYKKCYINYEIDSLLKLNKKKNNYMKQSHRIILVFFYIIDISF